MSAACQCTLEGRFALFANLAQVVVPFKEAQKLVIQTRPGSASNVVQFDDFELALADVSAEVAGCSSVNGHVKTVDRTPVVVLLGHFDHGKVR